MREFKFRIWHKKENRWLDPWAEEDPILSLKDFGEGCEVYIYDRETKNHSNLNCQMKDIVIQQYTGLKDRDGKDIYEGDIVLYPYKSGGGFSINEERVHWIQCEVKWKAGGLALYWGHNDCNIVTFNNKGFIVVGNIFQNPELVKL
jgi:uncharacterized phage protein (TIGR01671 family)